MKTLLNNTVHGRFFAPVISALLEAESTRNCPKISDENFLISGIGRVISNSKSGRDWVQTVQMSKGIDLTVNRFFDSLHSDRRLGLAEEVADSIRRDVDNRCPSSMNPLAAHPELDEFDVYASDGHYEPAASHTKPILGKVREPQYFLSLNLKSHSMTLLDIARPASGMKKEHDMKALKRLSVTELRLGAAVGTKVIHVYDRAANAYAQWRKWRAKGLYIISREKSNSKAIVIGENQWDKDDQRNIGIISDEIIGVFAGVMMRRIRYQDPANKKEYSYITSQMTLPPGIIAFLYKIRWDIEKKFDEKKNKLNEKKAWATGYTAKCIQMQLTCMAHNLLLLFERDIEINEGVRDEKVHAKRKKRVNEQLATIKRNGLRPNPMVIMCARITERSLQFIRWLRAHLWITTSWTEAMRSLRPFMEKYIS